MILLYNTFRLVRTFDLQPFKLTSEDIKEIKRHEFNLYYLGIKVGYCVILIFIHIYCTLSLETLYKSPFYNNDNKTIHLFDLQPLKSLQLWRASWADESGPVATRWRKRTASGSRTAVPPRRALLFPARRLHGRTRTARDETVSSLSAFPSDRPPRAKSGVRPSGVEGNTGALFGPWGIQN